MPTDTIAIASDHAGFELKTVLKTELEALGYAVLDLGTEDEASVDYPDYAYALTGALRDGRAARGVLVCGTGIGICIAANRDPAIRAAPVHDDVTARLSRQHNDANVICFGGRITTPEVAREALKVFLETEFEGGRHARRIGKLSNPA